MDSLDLASGDNNSLSPRHVQEQVEELEEDIRNSMTSENTEKKTMEHYVITPEIIEENEIKLKERITQCRDIIESLKLELKEEKSKLEKESKTYQYSTVSETVRKQYPLGWRDGPLSDIYTEDLPIASNIYEACVDSKLNCDENLMEYEKQLQKYQNTLNMAQLQKKNVIRKQMMAKAYRLKILEVENQCNIELLRVKQNLQCLEPLQMIASKWKCNTDDASYDLNNFELIPRYPELNAVSGSDITFLKDDSDNVKVNSENVIQDGSTTSSNNY
ncbi:uncharacterized protein ACR2FA_011690 [Aphomia sociella]